jgi:hypothetical protein
MNADSMHPAPYGISKIPRERAQIPRVATHAVNARVHLSYSTLPVSPAQSATLSRLKELLLPEHLKEPRTNHQLRQQRNPEPRPPQPLITRQPEIREQIPGSHSIWRARPRRDRHRTADTLARAKRRRDMEPRQRLQEDHAEPDTLEGIEDA